MNAKTELLEDLESIGKTTEDVIAIKITAASTWSKLPTIYSTTLNPEILEALDFNYDAGYGGQELEGTVLFNDHTWLSRGEYDGSEWWAYHQCPTVEDIITPTQ